MRAQAIFHNGKGRGSRFISWATRGPSHESTVYRDIPVALIRWANDTYGEYWKKIKVGLIRGTDWEFESIQRKGVHHQAFVPSPNQIWKDFEQTEEQAVTMFKRDCELVGKKYDWRSIRSFVTRSHKEDPNRWFCSERGCHVRREADIITQSVPDYQITPKWSMASPIFTNALNQRFPQK
jgi:hypothetical protein